ncbi:hypothetical protein B0A54_17589 [Friedmanniomyces endolithicus]|uniref:SUN domain-containing protein n=1 Tax=Friedmanniomyces endolithicus TaxID=329885 RepID=A0A4U0TU15_9PEZI|nr:hypothetical protein LTS09_017134 [Friedmanniomyces endolithicus]TKA25801.1 hypothetical protein B0A54_17589 [Friedmanniomyces endolithicus]
MARGELSDDVTILEIDRAVSVAALEPLTATVEHKKATEPVPLFEASISTSSFINATSGSMNATNSAVTSSILADLESPATSITTPLGSSLDAITCASSHLPSSPSVYPAFNDSRVLEVAAHEGDIDNATSATSQPSTSTSSSQSDQVQSFESSPTLNTSTTTIATSSDTASEHPRSTATEGLSNAGAIARNVTSSISASQSGVASSSASNSTRGIPTVSPAPPASSQESFFKSISKRLQQLESNSTISLQYIEEQSRILRDAFNKVEKRQIAATKTFLSQLNETVMNELKGFQQAYDHLWQGTVIELDGQRDQYQREMLALSSRLTLVADELVWQKRMGIVQSTLLLVCLSLVLFTRQGNTGYVETTLAQQLMSRSQAALRAGWESDPNSPSSPASRSPVSIFRRKLWKTGNGVPNDTLSGNGDTRPQTRDGAAPSTTVKLATPAEDNEEGMGEGLEGARDGPLRTQSSPPAPERGVQHSPSSDGDSRNSSPE